MAVDLSRFYTIYFYVRLDGVTRLHTGYLYLTHFFPRLNIAVEGRPLIIESLVFTFAMVIVQGDVAVL